MVKSKKTIIKIGTSNIVVPGNKLSYPPEFRDGSRLHYYSSFFNSVEINSSFYKVPMPATFKRWADEVPPDFQFTIKLWKEITHVKELNIQPELIDGFLDAANMLGDKKGCLLIQFPGKISMEYYGQVEKILERVRRHDKKNKWRMAVEFRNESWYKGETFELMDEYDASLVLHDMPKSRNAAVNKKASFVFIRFHGPAGDYRGTYSEVQLKDHAATIKKWVAAGRDVYAYFNNTIGSAFDNAQYLQHLINSKQPKAGISK